MVVKVAMPSTLVNAAFAFCSRMVSITQAEDVEAPAAAMFMQRYLITKSWPNHFANLQVRPEKECSKIRPQSTIYLSLTNFLMPLFWGNDERR